jgi:aspartate ammonia-lyase
VLEKGYLTKAELDDALSPENMTRPRYIHRRADVA